MSERPFDPAQVAVQRTAPDDDETRRVRELARSPAATALKTQLAIAYQVIADRGLDDGLAGHISLRVPDAPHFWVASLGQLFSEVTPDSLALVNGRGELVDGGPLINLAGFLIHAAIHQARPDVLCAVHTHPPAGCAFSALSRPLRMTDQNCCSFFDDVAVYDAYTGVVVDPEQTADLVAALGDKRALILRNHGLITAADSIEQATLDMVDLERTCDTNLRVLSTGVEPVTVPDDAAQQARSVLSQPLRYAAQWEATKRDLVRRNPVVAGFVAAVD